MTTLFRSGNAEAAELFALEHHFPIMGILIGFFAAANVGSVVLMLLAQ